MKLNFVLASLACLAAGYGLGRWHAGHKEAPIAAAAPGNARPLPPGTDGSTDATADPNLAHLTVRRPFPRGGARAWVIELVTRIRDGFDARGATSSLMRQWSTLGREEFPEIAALWREERAAHSRTDQRESLERLDFAESLFFDTWAQQDSLGLLAYWRSLVADENGRKNTDAVFKALGQAQPAEAAGALEGLTGDERSTAVRGLCEGLVAADPATVLEIAATINDPAAQQAARNAAARLAATDPERATRLAAQLADGPIGAAPLEKVAETWVTRDAVAAERWAREYQGPGSEAVLATVLARLPPAESERIAAELPSLLAANPDSKPLAGVAAMTALWMVERHSVDELMVWAETLPPGLARHRAQASVVQKWIREDAPAASEWIAKQPADPSRDDFVFPLIQRTGMTDPARALAWAKTLSGEFDRQHWYHQILSEWEKRDPQAAQAVQAALEKVDAPPVSPARPAEQRRR